MSDYVYRLVSLGAGFTNLYNGQVVLRLPSGEPAPVVGSALKGYRPYRRYFVAVHTEEPYLIVRIEGSRNPRTGPTPDDWREVADRLEREGLDALPERVALPINADLHTLHRAIREGLAGHIARAIRYLADWAPGRGPVPAPGPDWKPTWDLQVLSLEGLAPNRVLEPDGARPLEGSIRLGSVTPCRQRGFYLTGRFNLRDLAEGLTAYRLPVSRGAFWAFQDIREETWQYGHPAEVRAFRLGHHRVTFERPVSVVAVRERKGWRGGRYGRLEVVELVLRALLPVSGQVEDLRMGGEPIRFRARGYFRAVHSPRPGFLD